MNPGAIWEAVLGELEITLSKANFSTWFKNTFIYSVDKDKVTVGVPSSFYMEWLKNKYNKEIHLALKKLIPNLKTVEYKIASKSPKIGEEISEIKITKTEIKKKDIAQETLNPKYRFKNFVVGNNNKLAHAASLAIVEKPGSAYNPLFIWGGVGLGKTHLLQAIGNEILEKNPRKKVLYAPCEKFTNDFIQAVREGRGKAEKFKNKYRNVDSLLIDDIHFIAGKEGTQEEFFHTFNTLHQMNKQIVLTSDKPPKAISSLENRLKSRLGWGLTSDIGAPDLETRKAILQNKAQEKGLELPDDVNDFIAQNIQQNIRELEGALNRFIAHLKFYNLPPSVDVAVSALGTLISPKNKSISFEKIIKIVAGFYNINTDELLGVKRTKEIVLPRQVAMYLLRNELQYSFPQIANKIGKKDHTTIIYGCAKIEKQIKMGADIQKEISLIKEKLYV